MMTKSQSSSKGYLIQKRAFKNNGLILTLFTEKGELLSGIVYQGQKKNLALFHAYFIHVYARDGLSLISKIEPLDCFSELQGEGLFCALYLNELLGRLGKGLNEAPEVYLAYQKAITHLSKAKDSGLEYILRDFEFTLLKSLGYALDLSSDSNNAAILSNKNYFYNAGEGLTVVDDTQSYPAPSFIKGEELLWLNTQPLTEPKALKVAKWLNRQVINFLLEGRELVSRQLFKTH